MARQGYRADGASLVSVHLGNDCIEVFYLCPEPGRSLRVERPLSECSAEVQAAVHALLRAAGDELWEWFYGQAEGAQR